MERLAAKIGAAIIAALVFAALGCWVGFAWGESRSADKVAKLEKEVAAAKAQKTLDDDMAARRDEYCDAIDGALTAQNEVIAELGRRALANQSAAADAAAAAREASDRMQRAAANLLASRPPPGVEACAAATADFDNELRAERADGAL
ncbi:MAG TPA: hypothetical protein VIG97_02370 [Luteimonas sp.]